MTSLLAAIVIMTVEIVIMTLEVETMRVEVAVQVGRTMKNLKVICHVQYFSNLLSILDWLVKIKLALVNFVCHLAQWFVKTNDKVYKKFLVVLCIH